MPCRDAGQDHDERGQPGPAFDFAQLPNEGVGLARLEFIINNMIGVHPKALLNYGPAG
jgi:pyruvate,water dikinase